jgi:protein-L-isoaspartate(D-aspartate) O-methyltransferase
MRDIPRELFLPTNLRQLAYIDEDVPLGNGRVLIEPMVIARLIQLLAPAEGDRALVVAAGAGYGAALLAACGMRVTALEEDRALIQSAEAALEVVAPSVSVVAGPLGHGWPSGAPYNRILLEGAVTRIPAALAEHLRADTGRLVTVLREPGAVGHAVLAEPTPAGLRAQPMFDCATPWIPSLLPKPGFVF